MWPDCCDKIYSIYIIFLDIMDKMFEQRRRDGGGGYVGEDLDNAYEEEVEQIEKDARKRASRPVAKIAPQMQVVEVGEDSSDSDEPPPLIDTTPLQQFVDFMERRRRIITENQHDQDNGSDSDVLA